MLKWIIWALAIWGLLFLAPPTRPLAVYFLPLRSVGGDVLGVLAFVFLIGGSVLLAYNRHKWEQEKHRRDRRHHIEDLEEELFH